MILKLTLGPTKPIGCIGPNADLTGPWKTGFRFPLSDC
jgi:hypothetical protein